MPSLADRVSARARRFDFGKIPRAYADDVREALESMTEDGATTRFKHLWEEVVADGYKCSLPGFTSWVERMWPDLWAKWRRRYE